MLKKDKQKVVDEVWTEDRVKAFLDLSVPEGINPDFYILHAAYKNMRIENFRAFIGYFREQNRDIQATDSEGQTLLSIIKTHTKSTAYAKALSEQASD